MYQQHTAHVTNRLPGSGPSPAAVNSHWDRHTLLQPDLGADGNAVGLYTMCKPSRACWRTLCDTICSLKGWRLSVSTSTAKVHILLFLW